jgi:hypothetical protein
MNQVEALVQRALQHGPKGVLDEAEAKLTVAEYRTMLRRMLEVGVAVRCARPGCGSVFIPRGRQRFHSTSCKRTVYRQETDAASPRSGSRA